MKKSIDSRRNYGLLISIYLILLNVQFHEANITVRQEFNCNHV